MTDAVQVVTHGNASCALDRAAVAHCWGWFRRADLSQAWRAEPIPALAGSVELAAGIEGVCGRRADGTVHCWDPGYPDSTMFGNFPTPLPQVVDGIRDAREIALGERIGCARLGNGVVRCWGNHGPWAARLRAWMARHLAGAVQPPTWVVFRGLDDHAGMTVDGTAVCVRHHAAVSCAGRTVPHPWTGVEQVSMRTGHIDLTCVLLADRTVSCAGWNAMGGLGDGTTVEHADSVQPIGVTDAVSVAVGGAFSCALRRDGSVMCWGMLESF